MQRKRAREYAAESLLNDSLSGSQEHPWNLWFRPALRGGDNKTMDIALIRRLGELRRMSVPREENASAKCLVKRPGL